MIRFFGSDHVLESWFVVQFTGKSVLDCALAFIHAGSILKTQPAWGLSPLGQPGWIPASQLISVPLWNSRPCGSAEPGTKSYVPITWPVLPSYFTSPGFPSL